MDGAPFEYVHLLMEKLFDPLHEAMWEQTTWTDDVVKTVAARMKTIQLNHQI